MSATDTARAAAALLGTPVQVTCPACRGGLWAGVLAYPRWSFGRCLSCGWYEPVESDLISYTAFVGAPPGELRARLWVEPAK
jgi:hypothetical protein